MTVRSAQEAHHAMHAALVEAAPAEQVLRKDRSFRYQRNGIVYARDGRVGTLRHVVIDHKAGEVTELIVEIKALNKTVAVPVSLVEKTGGSAVFLALDRADFIRGATSSPAFTKKGFRKVRLGSLRKQAQQAAERGGPQAVTGVGDDWIETPLMTRWDLVAKAGQTVAEGQGS